MLEVNPNVPVAYNLVALGYLPLGRLEEAAQMLELASERKMQDVPALRGLAALDHHTPANAIEWLQVNAS